ncbi:MAG: MFS transporter small subunit [Pseudonocardia sp.]
MTETQPSAAALPDRYPPHRAVTTLAWLWVAAPFAYGLWQLLIKVSQLFGG